MCGMRSAVHAAPDSTHGRLRGRLSSVPLRLQLPLPRLQFWPGGRLRLPSHQCGRQPLAAQARRVEMTTRHTATRAGPNGRACPQLSVRTACRDLHRTHLGPHHMIAQLVACPFPGRTRATASQAVLPGGSTPHKGGTVQLQRGGRLGSTTAEHVTWHVRCMVACKIAAEA